ncbi:MAG TPA: helix-turn-helix transcriptional regulator [Ktedonobacterales bacterium]|nr:helix-turn-helix transcriptional regulator [Ktedonobacterales bacterium]
MRHPAQPGSWLQTARTLLDGSCDAPLPLEQLAARLGVSRYHLIRAFRRAWGVTPHQYRTLRRIERAQALLANSDLTVTEICFAVGFQSPGSFSALFRRATGQAPHAWREHIRRRDQAIACAIPLCLRIMYAAA